MKIFEITLREETVAKIADIKPGAEATIDMGDGTKTVIDLKKNPTALMKSPDGKIMMNKVGLTSGGVQTEPPDPTTMMKPGEPVFVTDKTMENNSDDGRKKLLTKFKKKQLPQQNLDLAQRVTIDQLERNPMASAVTRRIMNQHPEWLMRYGVNALLQAIDDVTEGDQDWEEIGSSDVSAYVRYVADYLRDHHGSRDEF